MAEENGQQNAAAAGEQANQNIRFNIQKIFIKDASFESPGSPDCFRQPYKPTVDLSINTKSRKLDDDNNYEIILRLTIDVKQDDKSLFLVEVQQAGIFLINGLEGERLGQVVNITCPSVLFPYGREAVDSLVTKGGFPPLMLAPVNFENLYLQAREQQAKQTEGQGDATPAS